MSAAAASADDSAEMKVREQRLLERLPLVTYMLRPDAPSGAVYVSPQIADLFGYPAESFADAGFWTARVAEDDRPSLVDALARLRATRRPMDVEYRVHAADGSLRWVRDNATIDDELIYGYLVDVTHETALQDELARERASIDAFFSSSLVGLAVTDGDGRYVRINEALARINGAPVGDHVGRTLAEIAPDLAAVIDPLRLASLREPLEITLPGRDGQATHRLVSFFPFAIDGETYHGRVVVDLSEQRRAQEAEEQYRRLLEELPLVAYVNAIDPRRPVFATPQVEWLTGYPAQAFLDDPDLGNRLVHPDDRAAVADAEQRARAGGTTFEHEYRIVRADGGVRWVLDRMAIVRDGDGNPLYEHGFLVDVTERNETERLLRAIWDEALDGILILDDEGRCVDANAAACEVTGRTRDELLASGVDELIESGTATLDEFLELGYSHGEAVIVRPDGERREIEYAAKAGFVPGRHMSAIRDVTARKQLERELWRAQRLESLGELAGGVAQDFNSLLTAIRGYAQLLQARVGPGSVEAHHAEEIDRAADRAAALTAQLLALGRRQTLKSRALDLNRRICELRPLLQLAAGREAELHYELDSTLRTARVDAGVIATTLEQLVKNAGEATAGGARITISTANADIRGRDDLPDGEYVAVRVDDDGRGIDPDTLERVFDPFFTTKAVGGGAGLALASAYGTVRQSGGTIDAESEVDHGSSFTVLLPAAATPARETVLVVDSDDAVRDRACDALADAGYGVLAARSAGEALRVAGTAPAPVSVLAAGDEPHIDALRDALARATPDLRTVALDRSWTAGGVREAVAAATAGLPVPG